MGGQEGIKGYTYQTLVAILELLTNKKHGTITVEPKTKNDKVDILIHDDIETVIQVKHTVNNFTFNKAVTWINDLILDYSNADKYSLYLIGVCGKNDKLKELNKFKEPEPWTDFRNKVYSEMPDTIKNNKCKIYIESFNENTEYFLECLISRLDRFFSNKDYIVDYNTKSLIINTLIGKLSLLSTNGTPIGVLEYKQKILSYIKDTFPIKKEIELSVNLNSKDNKTNKFNFDIQMDTLETKKLMLAHLEVLRLRKLEDINDNENIIYTIDDRKFNIIKSYFINTCKDTKIDINKDLFCVPDDLKNNIELMYNAILQEERLLSIKELLNNTYGLDLYLFNNGMVSCENIDVELTILSDAKIFNFDKLDFNDIPEKVINCIYLLITQKLCLTENAEIKSSGINENNIYNEELFLIHNIPSIFGYKIFKDRNGQDIIKYNFSSLNVDSKIWFPSKLLIVTNKSFTISYKITSDTHSEINAGKIEINI